jgi:hypothetical protein
MVRQLRIYTINKGHLDDFAQGWLEHVYPLHLKMGYKIERAGVIPERNEFVWEVSYDGPEDWNEKQAAYFASPERKAVDPDPARFIAKTDRWFVEDVLGGQ